MNNPHGDGRDRRIFLVQDRSSFFDVDPDDVQEYSARGWKSRLPRPGEISGVPQNSQRPSPSTQQAPPQTKT